uniref:Uncharacterized protein n=1 Tax=Glossina pallidipes TaxID=7398 RepID=A0A1A9Z826_GLOPL
MACIQHNNANGLRRWRALFNKTTLTISKKLRVYEYRESSFSMKTLSWHIKEIVADRFRLQMYFSAICIRLYYIVCNDTFFYLHFSTMKFNIKLKTKRAASQGQTNLKGTRTQSNINLCILYFEWLQMLGKSLHLLAFCERKPESANCKFE